MGEAVTSAAEVIHPKPSRFQFVPVPGEFTRGRWKCRDSVGPYAETLEFDKGHKGKKSNPNKITVTKKLVKTVEKPATIQVMSVASPSQTDSDGNWTALNGMNESVCVTRKNGITILRKASIGTKEGSDYENVKEIAMAKLGYSQKNELEIRVPPTPMNTPPSTVGQAGFLGNIIGESANSSLQSHSNPKQQKKAFQVRSGVDIDYSQPPTRKFSHENARLQRSDSQQFANIEMSQSYSDTLPANTVKPRVFHIQPVPESEISGNSTPAVNSSMEDVKCTDVKTKPKKFEVQAVKEIPITTIEPLVAKENTDMGKSFLDYDANQNNSGENTTRSVMITVSPTSTKRSEPETVINNNHLDSFESSRDVASSVSSLDACGIPIHTSSPNAPHSTPYGTPKENGSMKSPGFEMTNISTNGVHTVIQSQSVIAVSESNSATNMMPIDNKIEQAMELVKTHLTYAVREEVDTLKNTIQELEHQLREYQYECGFYRQNVSQELIDQAGNYVRQQMQKHPIPTRRAVSAVGVSNEGGMLNTTASQSSQHMQNLQSQIQKIKQNHPRITNDN